MGTTIRSFIAVLIPDPLIEAIARVQQELRGMVRDLKWVSPERIHATLKFLGNVPEDHVRAIADALAQAAELPPFTVEIAGLGAFPGPGRLRVLWAGMRAAGGSGETPLVTLARRVDAQVHTLGYPLEERPFVPHLTLARSRDRGGQAVPTDFARCLTDQAQAPLGSFLVDAIHLMRSDLAPKGPTYTPLARIPLEAR